MNNCHGVVKEWFISGTVLHSRFGNQNRSLKYLASNYGTVLIGSFPIQNRSVSAPMYRRIICASLTHNPVQTRHALSLTQNTKLSFKPNNQ